MEIMPERHIRQFIEVVVGRTWEGITGRGLRMSKGMEVRKGFVSTRNCMLFSVAGTEFQVGSSRLGKVGTYQRFWQQGVIKGL